MNANCVICSDSFDEINPIAAAPCGHVYHANCLTMWIGQSKTCPQCRSRTFLKGIQRLYFNFQPKSDSNSSDLENEVVRLTSLLSAKHLELAACKQERDRLIDSEKNTLDQLQAVSRIQHENFEIARSYSELEARVLELDQINATLTNDLEHLNSIRIIVNGTQRDAENILEEYNDHSSTARQLATYCACLKRELLDLVQSKENIKDLNTKLQRENNVYAAETRFYADALGISDSKPRVKKVIHPYIQETVMAVPSAFKSSENVFSASTSREGAVSEEICLSPLSVTFNRNEFNMCLKTRNNISESSSQGNLKLENVSPVAKRKTDNVVRIKLGGHGNFTASGMRQIRIIKKN